MKKGLFISLLIALFIQSVFSQKYARKFADSEMKRFPQAYQLDHGKRLFFGYSQGLGCLAMLKLWQTTGDRKYYEYVRQWADTIINDKGQIYLYEPESHNIDFINPGKILFVIYKETKQEKYKMAMDSLREQMKTHPRTSEGVFWHKKVYPHQIWLDGLYMGDPFLAEYAVTFHEPALLDDAIHQLLVGAKRTYDAKTGLYYHAYDESRSQKWADKTTGHSPNFWGRSIGWFFMALVDVLDYVPQNHPQRGELIQLVKGLTETLPKYQDNNGLWYQVVDQPYREGNYAEASASSMYMYAIAKAVNKGYVDKKYKKIALKAFKGITTKLIKTNPDGTLSLTQCCAVAGLGGNPYRDGSYDYYIQERIRDNDAKATGPFILGCVELGR
jgi:Predicted unsaturated glucuronyl hydrolase involved in regulation of bacterial surface properties, and related proteins